MKLMLPLAALLLPVAASAQEPAAPDAAWHNAQMLALLELRAEDGWRTTESGLRYRRVRGGEPGAASPSPDDTVTIHYVGTFIDGREFDSSWSRNEPAEFPLNRVIKGWTEGVGLMREGETFEFVIPASLGYGDRWVGGDDLPPNSTLLFTVELLEVKPAS